MSRIYNFFNLRWTDGYSHVSDAPTEVIVDLEAIIAQQPSAVSTASIITQRVRVGGHRDASLGILKLDVDVGGRRCSYTHVLVLASGYAPLPGERWLRIVRDRYGTDVESRIQTLYERLARLEKANGRRELEPLEVRPEDVASLVSAEPAPAPVGSERTRAAPSSPEVPPRSARRARVPAWTLAAMTAVAAIFAIAWALHRAGGSDCGEVSDNRAQRKTCADLETKLDSADAQITELKDENRLCLERKTGNVQLDTCLTKLGQLDTCLVKQLECEKAAKTNATKVARLEAARNDAEAQRKASEINPRVEDVQLEAQRKLEEEKEKTLQAIGEKNVWQSKFKEACKLCRASCSSVCSKPGGR